MARKNVRRRNADRRQRNRTIITAILMVVFVLLGGLFTARLLEANSIATALYRVDVNVSNSSETGLTDVQAPFAYSVASLIDGNFIQEDALDTHIHQGSSDIPHMPPNNRIQVEGAIQNDGGVFTEYTSEAQSTATGDLPLLPAVPAVDDAWYAGCDNPCRIITHEIATAGVGTWTLAYEYWDGSTWTALSNVADRTVGFTVGGQSEVSWDAPDDWATRTVTGSAVSSYWARGRVSAFTSISVQPLGTRQRYENGQWWTWLQTLGANQQQQFSVYLGGSADLQASHQVFPGLAGIITGDTAGLELGANYSFGLSGRLDVSASGLRCILCKTSAITVQVTGTVLSPLVGIELKGGGTTVATTPATGSATGRHTVITAADGTAAVTWVGLSDGVGSMVSYTPQTITDNSNNLTWASTGGVDYFDWIRVDSAVATVFNVDLTQVQFGQGILDGTESFTDGLGLSSN